jgi:Xaa-Pro aminopeptidase
VLWPLISNLRTIKTKDELELIRYVCKLTTHALKIAVKSTKPGLTQVQLHSVFHFQHSIKSGSILLGFASICSSGRDCATLHYIDNDKIIKDG